MFVCIVAGLGTKVCALVDACSWVPQLEDVFLRIVKRDAEFRILGYAGTYLCILVNIFHIGGDSGQRAGACKLLRLFTLGCLKPCNHKGYAKQIHETKNTAVIPKNVKMDS